jgi:uncharacterized membrane protein
MTKNPLVNALGASAYIILIVSLMNFISQTQGNKPDTPFTPVIFLSLLTLSVSIMAYVFFYQPVQLLMDGKKKEAVKLLTRTIGIFAVITAVGLVLLFSGLI